VVSGDSQVRLHTASGELQPTPPFDLAQSLAFLGRFGPMRDEQAIGSGTLAKALRLDSQTIVFRLHDAGTVEAPRLAWTLYADRPLGPSTRDAALDRLRFFLSLADDLRPFYALAREDPVFRGVVERLYGYHQVKFPTPFENACWAILTQRTSTAVAHRWKRDLIARLGGALTVDGVTYRAFPTPRDVLRAPPDAVFAVVETLRKGEYLLAAAEAFAAADETWLRTGHLDEVYRWLRRIKGLGEWSAAFVLLRGLGRTERLLLGGDDSTFIHELQRVAASVYGSTLTAAEIRAIAQRYGPWQGYWAHYLRAAGHAPGPPPAAC